MNTITELDFTKPEALHCLQKVKESAEKTGEWLLQFHKRKGWKALGYDSFKACCAQELEDVFGSKSQVYRLMQQAEVTAEVSPMGDTSIPERATRELAKLPREQQKPAYEAASEAAGGEPPTAKQVAAAVEQVKAATPPKPKEEPAAPKPKQGDRYAAALERIGNVCGAKVAKAIRDGIMNKVKPASAIFWAGLKDAGMMSIYELVVSKGWKPEAAHRFISKVPDVQTRIAQLQTLAIAGGGSTMVVTGAFATVTYNYRSLSAQHAKVKSLFNL